MLIKLNEDSRNQLLSKARKGANYKTDQSKGKNRYERRTKSKISNSVREYNQLDMNKFFKDDILDLYIKVHGETDDYMVGISFSGILDLIQQETKKNPDLKVDLRLILQMLKRSFNKEDRVLVRCNCLHPDTKIKLLDGTTSTVQEMCSRYESGEQLYVYSVDEQGDFKPGVVEKVWKTGSSNKFIKVTLDNDKEIITTPEHLYMTRSGEYKPASELVLGESLMPMYFNQTNGYQTVKLNTEVRGWRSVYKLVAEYFKSNEIKEAESRASEDDNMAYKVAIHHSDFNKSNNNPENLQIMTAKEHWMYHASLPWHGWSEETKQKVKQISAEWARKRNANPTEAMIKQRQAFTEAGVRRNYDEDRKLQQAKILRRVSKEYWKSLDEESYKIRCEQISKQSIESWEKGCFDTEKFHEAAKKRGEFLSSPEIEALAAEGVKRYWESISDEDLNRRKEIAKQNILKAQEAVRGVPFTEEHKRKISEARLRRSPEEVAAAAKKCHTTKIKTILQHLIDNNQELTLENYESRRKQLNGYPKITTIYKDIDDAITQLQLNHKIINIEYIELPETPVYDIKVKDFPNFVVDAGVVLHNCPDATYRMNYWQSVNDIILGDKETRPSDETNPYDNLGPACKHVILVLSNVSWIVKLASAINNYIRYIQDHYEKAYAEIIYPKLYGKEYEDPVQLGLFDKDELDNMDVDQANEYGRDRGKFKKGNQSGIQFAKEPISDDDQIELDLS